MRIIFKSLLVSSALLVTVHQSHAEQLPNFTGQPPIWNFGQTPIAWGDCVPVPVVPVPFGQNNMSMGQMGMNQVSIPQPMMQQFPIPMNEQPIMLPAPSPFFNNAIPARIPMPVVADLNQTVCDDSALQALQAKYDQGAAASRAKIAEITQALNDSNNQMTGAKVIIDNFSKKSEQSNSKLSSELSMLEMELTNSHNANKSLQAKLVTAASNAGDQARKVNRLNQSAVELVALQSAYKTRNNENVELKMQLAKLTNSNKSLQTQLSTTSTNAGSQAGPELTALKSACKKSNDENIELKTMLADLEGAYKILQTQLSTAKTESGSQARKITALSQSSIELTAFSFD